MKSRTTLFALTMAMTALGGCASDPPPPPPPPPPAAPLPPPPPPRLPEIIKISNRIEFESDKAILLPQSLPILNEVVDVMKKNPQIQLVQIGGHTDRQGDRDHNLVLSQARAEAVKVYLVSQGVEVGRLKAMGFGYDNPVAPNDTPAGRLKNRRVEFRIKKQGQ